MKAIFSKLNEKDKKASFEEINKVINTEQNDNIYLYNHAFINPKRLKTIKIKIQDGPRLKHL